MSYVRVLALVLVPAVALADPPDTTVCHLDDDGIEVLDLPGPAVDAHLLHGDHLPGTYYADADGDGFGDPATAQDACATPEGTVDNADDCDDTAAWVHPGAEEQCNSNEDEDCDGEDTLCKVEFQGWTVSSGRVVPGPTPGTIVATFEFDRVADDAAATRGGGACLLADLFTNDPVWANVTCTTAADCVGVPIPSPGGFIYCTHPDGTDEPNRCWTRPGNYCSRSGYRTEGVYTVPGVLAWTPTATNPTTPGSETVVPAPGHAGQGGAPVRWMLLTCMAAASTPSGCASPDPTLHVYSSGPVFWWTPDL